MTKKKLMLVYTEGVTDEVFYKKVFEQIKINNGGEKFNIDKLEHKNFRGISKFANKMIHYFNKNYCSKEYLEYDKIVCLCYDLDVFTFNQNPPIDREKVVNKLTELGAKVISIEANSCIEDFFLKDIESIRKHLKLPKNKIPKHKNGIELLKAMYEMSNKVYIKGEIVEGFIGKLNMDLILSAICCQISQVCKELGYDCIGNKCENHN